MPFSWYFFLTCNLLTCFIQFISLTDHAINRVTLEFSFNDKERTTALSTTRDFFYNNILPVLNSNFDHINGDVYIDKMVIDIGCTTPNDFSTQFIKAFSQSWQDHVKQQPDHIIYTTGTKATDKNKSALSVAQVAYFLQRGYWPWNWQMKTEKELMLAAGIFFSDQQQLLQLLVLIKSEGPVVAERLIRFIATHVAWQRLLINAIKQYHTALEPALLYFDKHFERQVFKEHNFYSAFFKKLLLLPSPLQSQKELMHLLSQMIQEQVAAAPLTDIKGTVKKLQMQLQKAGDFSVLRRMLPVLEDLFVYRRSEQIIADDRNSDPIPYFTDGEDEKVQIANAGLVLFHPYLRYVFKDLEWINDKHQFVNKKAQQKAVLWLQYIINSKSRHPEHSLVLNKILCGWPVNKPLTTRCNFSKKEKLAVQDLIDALKEHWSVLRNTSAHGVVKSFIDRPGMIQKTGKNFLLQIEKNTIDILLESLPFGIQTIKLPWNAYIIHTEWVG